MLPPLAPKTPLLSPLDQYWFPPEVFFGGREGEATFSPPVVLLPVKRNWREEEVMGDVKEKRKREKKRGSLLFLKIDKRKKWTKSNHVAQTKRFYLLTEMLQNFD